MLLCLLSRREHLHSEANWRRRALGDEFRKGGRTGPIRVFTTEGIEGESYRLLLKTTLEKMEARLAELRQIGAEEPEQARPESQRLLEQQLAAETDTARELVNGEVVDAQAFTRSDVRLHELAVGINDVIWEARLRALLLAI